MKIISLNFLLFLLIFSVNAQTVEKKIISNIQGNKFEDRSFFEVEGYHIFVANHTSKYNANGIKVIKRHYKLDKQDSGMVNRKLNFLHKYFIKNFDKTDSIKQKQIYYLIENNSFVTVIGLSTDISRDEDIERIFVKNIAENTIPKECYVETEIDSFNLAGRFVPLGALCNWMEPRNLQCPQNGQINWSECRTLERAKEIVNIQFKITENRKIGEVLQRDSIDIIFEGKETKALKIKYKIKIPQLIMGGSNILIVYYVTAEIRGKFIACVLSQYTDDGYSGQLAGLLGELMSIKN